MVTNSLLDYFGSSGVFGRVCPVGYAESAGKSTAIAVKMKTLWFWGRAGSPRAQAESAVAFWMADEAARLRQPGGWGPEMKDWLGGTSHEATPL